MKTYVLQFGKKFSIRRMRYTHYWKIIASNGELICSSTPSQPFYNLEDCKNNAKLVGLSITNHFKIKK